MHCFIVSPDTRVLAAVGLNSVTNVLVLHGAAISYQLRVQSLNMAELGWEHLRYSDSRSSDLQSRLQ